MNSTENSFNMNIPLLNGVLRRLNSNNSNEGIGIPLENRMEREKENELIQKYSNDLINNKPLLLEYEKISTELLKLGYTPQQVVHSFLVYKYETIDDAIEVIANHEYIESDNERCFICGNEKKEHQRNSSIQDDNKEQKQVITKEEIVKRLKSSNENKDIIIEIDKQESCPICFEAITNDNQFNLKCNHVYCKDCITDYLKEEIKNSRVLPLNCPTVKCNEPFTLDIIKSLLNSDDNSIYIYKYEKFLQREKIRNDPELVVCPILNCEGYAKKTSPNTTKNETDIIIETSTSLKNDKEALLKQKEKLICDKGHSFCSLCNQAWHGETPCDSDKEIKEFATYSGFIVKKCPKCKTWTEKNEGCNHMKCKICNYNWCWLCEQECKENHFFIEGTPCYGKQFNREENPDELMLAMMIINAGAFVRNFLFLYILGMYIIKMSVIQLFRNRNIINENNNERNRRPSKCAIWIGYLLLLSILFIIMFCSNGFILFSISTSSSGTDKLNKVSRKLLSYSNIILFIMFFFIGGPVLTFAWYSTMVIYATYQIIKI